MDFFFHPQFVHFPVALLLTAGLFYVASVFYKRDFCIKAGFILHVLGWLGSIASILTGRSAEVDVVHTAQIQDLLVLHERLAYLVAWIFAMLGIWMYLRQKRIAKAELILFLVVFWGANGSMAYMAHLGGEMVYEEGAGVEPMEDELKKKFQNEQSKLQEYNP